MAEHAIVDTVEMDPWTHQDGVDRQVVRVTCSCGRERELLTRGDIAVRGQQVANMVDRHRRGTGAPWDTPRKRPSAYAQGRRSA